MVWTKGDTMCSFDVSCVIRCQLVKGLFKAEEAKKVNWIHEGRMVSRLASSSVFLNKLEISGRLGIIASINTTFAQLVLFLIRGVFLTAATEVVRSFSIRPELEPLLPGPKQDALADELFLPLYDP